MNSNQALIKSTIADFSAMLEESKSELRGLSNVLLGRGWIVVTGEDGQQVPQRFDIENGVVTNPQFCGSAAKATRFTERDAKMIASKVKNGLNQKGRALHVTHALANQIATLTKIIAQLEERLEPVKA